jgi:signal transduction histidine kinase
VAIIFILADSILYFILIIVNRCIRTRILIDNSLKFTKLGKISIISERVDGIAKISVRDNGTGIDPEIFPRLFSKFATKSSQGTGLGLYISNNIIEAHGGNMLAWNNDEQEKGATFEFALPIN